jgi:phage tail sheath protein FI
VDYRSSGVYVEEVTSAAKLIAGAGNSTAAFIGFFEVGKKVECDDVDPGDGQ